MVIYLCLGLAVEVVWGGKKNRKKGKRKRKRKEKKKKKKNNNDKNEKNDGCLIFMELRMKELLLVGKNQKPSSFLLPS